MKMCITGSFIPKILIHWHIQVFNWYWSAFFYLKAPIGTLWESVPDEELYDTSGKILYSSKFD